MISRGTNPLQTIQLPFDCSFIEKVEIMYIQDDKVILKKTENDVTLEQSIIFFRLTQEETFMFNDKMPVVIQTRIKLKNSNDVMILPKAKISVGACFSEEVL